MMVDSVFYVPAAVVVLLALVLTYIVLAVKQVPQGYEWTVERFGRYVKTLQPGLHFITPLIERIGFKVCMKEEVLDIPSQEVISKDNAMVQVDGVVFYQIVDAARAAYEVNYLVHAIRNLVMTNIRTVLGSLDLDEQLSHRDQINTKLLSVVDEAVSPWGLKITRIEIKDIKPPQDIVNSMARQMKAEREKRALVLESEGQRQAAILTAEGEKQAEILRAEAQLDVASKQAEIRERLAQAEANSIAIVAESANEQSMKYFIAQKYTESLKELSTSSNSKIIFLPLETQNLLAPLIGILKGISKEDDNK